MHRSDGFAALSPPHTNAATEEILAAATACEQIDWKNQAGAERARTYRQADARGSDADIAFDTELTNRLDALESAYRDSREICHLREHLGLGDESCGTISLAPYEFVVLRKTMIVNEDAGWVRRDRALERALRLDE